MNESPDPWTLVVTDGPDQGKVFPINDYTTVIIGRGSESDTKIRDPRLSRIHCELQRSGDRWLLIDRGGSGGTFVDGVQIDGPRPLSAGAAIRLGDSLIHLQCHSLLDMATAVPGRLLAPHVPSHHPMADDKLQEPAASPVDGPSPNSVASPTATPWSAPAVSKIANLEGEVFLRFRLEKLVATGQNSVMFRGLDLKHQRPVAVKILKPQMATTETQRKRFIRAMRTMLPVKHPNIVRTRKAGQAGPYCWAAFDWVDGTSVADLIDSIGVSGMLDWKEVWRVAVHIGRALEEAGKHEIVHRNVNPSNLIRRANDRAYLLTDLIFARALEYTDAPQLTRPGDVLGDLGYIAPERVLESTCVDARSDQYSLGATLYALLTGKPPYAAMGIVDLLDKFRESKPESPTSFRLGLDERFSDVVMKMIERSVTSRFTSPASLLRELQHVGHLAGMDADWDQWNTRS